MKVKQDQDIILYSSSGFTLYANGTKKKKLKSISLRDKKTYID